MSPENVRLIHSVYAAINRRDMAALQEMLEASPDYEWETGPDMPDPGRRIGPDSTLRHLEETFAAFDRINTVVREVIDLGPAGAIFLVRHHARGAASGAEVQRDEVHFWRTEDDRVVGLEEFLTVEDARAAAARV